MSKVIVIHAADSDLFVKSDQIASAQKIERGEGVSRLKIILLNGATVELVMYDEQATSAMNKIHKAMRS